MNDMSGNPKILAVDDKPENLYALEQILKKLEVEVIPASSGNEALSLTLKNEFCLAIVDIQMPLMDGYELVELLRGNPSTASLPVIFISAIYSDEYHHRKGYDAGAVDFLSKPFIPEILLSKVKVFLDLYQKRILLEELARQNAALYKQEEARAQELAQLNMDKDKFFSIVSHDLRTPFNGLIGNAQLMVMELQESGQSEMIELAETILNSAQNAHRLLENLLTWSMIQRGVMVPKPTAVSFYTVVQSTIAIYAQIAADKEIHISNAIPPETTLFADENMLQTVLRNLLLNAIKFTDVGGKITIAARKTLNAGGEDENATQFATIVVEDTGVGLSPVDIEKIFKIDTHHNTNGTAGEAGAGLGLVLCKEMVACNGGKIWVNSILGKGTKVFFTVPTSPLEVN